MEKKTAEIYTFNAALQRVKTHGRTLQASDILQNGGKIENIKSKDCRL